MSRSRSCVDYIDWTPFFAAWELPGHYPEILSDDEAHGRGSTRALRTTRSDCSTRVVDEQMLSATAAVGFWPAGSTADDDIVLFTDESRSTELDRLHTLRQQMAKPDGRPNAALSDYTAPVESGVATTSVPSRSPPAAAWTRPRSASRRRTTTTRPSC